MAGISVQLVDSVAVLTLDQPGSKVNVLSRAAIEELGAVIDDLAGRTNLRGLVLESVKPGIFIAGADLKEFADVPRPDHAPTRTYIETGLRVLDALESLPFATVACIDGVALGGGLEVALACDFRLAGTNPKFKLGLPEVSLGLIPGWGGTQRLPRIIGQEPAIDMIVHNQQFNAETACARGLVARIVPSENLKAEALRLVDEVQTTGSWRIEREGKRRSIDDARSLAALRDSVQAGPQHPAALAVIDVIEAGCRLPLPAAIGLETDAFMRVVSSPEARQLIGDFFARRKK